MAKITSVKGRFVLDSRGFPTVEAEIWADKVSATAICPSGTSTGLHEANEIRDGGKSFFGQGVQKVISHINEPMAKALKGKDCTKQSQVDDVLIELDGTSNRSRMGANAMTAVSLANCRLGAAVSKKRDFEWIQALSQTKRPVMPVPFMNVINGGAHAGNDLAFQEFQLIPVHADSFSHAMQMGVEAYQALKVVIQNRFGKSAINVGLEGGFAPNLSHVEDALKLLTIALKEAGHEKDIMIGMDLAATRFFKDNHYTFEGHHFSNIEYVEYLEDLVERYPIVALEDPFAQDDWQGFCLLNKSLGDDVLVIGDDLLVTRTDRVQRAAKLNACNTLLMKVNQVGTLTESLSAAAEARKAQWNVVVSHRSGDSEDPFIADLAVGLGANFIKAGAPARSERTAKYNQLLRIEEYLGKKAEYAGKVWMGGE